LVGSAARKFEPILPDDSLTEGETAATARF
jgi:hypothetical protein